MMKYRMQLLIVVILVLSTVTIASAQETIQIWGWLYDGDEVTVTTSDSVYLSVRWGACTKGLASAWAKRAYVVYTIDGEAVTSSKKEMRGYWSQPIPIDDHPGIPLCINNSDVIWFVYWDYPVTLDPGEYEISFEYGIDPPFSDGIDADGDSRPDKYGHLFSTEFTLIVTE